MEVDIFKNFQVKEILCKNQTEKRLFLLGEIKSKEGQAILIVSTTTPSLPPYEIQELSSIFKNDIYSRYDALVPNKLEIQMIYPVTQKHKDKYKQKKRLMVEETAEEYDELKTKLLQKQLSHIDWVDNIIDGKAEVERVIFRCQEFVLLPDFKYSDLNDTGSLHLLCIFTNQKLNSIRDLRGQHLNLLKKVKKQIQRVLLQRFKLQVGQYRTYFHYPPTFYRMHLHITSLKVQAYTALVDRAHLLSHVISNLQIFPDYYTKATLIKTKQKNDLN